ncbi:MAG: Co2+/Mg2+ efflux protein ApaG [Gemmatimonadota bacterium]|jgi:ApaG protein
MIYQEVTAGIVVRVRPAFSLVDSSPEEGRFVFTYHVEMENQGDQAAQLLFRHWKIHDSTGEDSEVNGEGVVGQQPLLTPGGTHEYKSFCILESPAGYMEGHYTFERDDGSRFDARVPRFSLAAYLPGPEERATH